jgi:hypothetical protein
MPSRSHASGISSTDTFELMPTGSPQKGMRQTPHVLVLFEQKPSQIRISCGCREPLRSANPEDLGLVGFPTYRGLR